MSLNGGFGNNYLEVYRKPTAVESVITEMLICVFGDTRRVGGLYQNLLGLAANPTSAQQMLANAFARRASKEKNLIKRSRLYKVARSVAPLHVVAKAFEAQGLILIDARFENANEKGVIVTYKDFNAHFAAQSAKYFPRVATTAATRPSYK